MKYFAVLLVIAIVAGVQALTDEQKARVKAYHKECAEKTGVDPALVAKARKGEFTDDAKLKAHLFCFSKKAGFQNEAGEIQRDVLKTKIGAEIKNDETTDKLISKCAIQKATPEETAYDTVKCYWESPNHVTIA